MIDIDCMFVLPPVGIDENPAIIIVHSDGLVNLYCCLWRVVFCLSLYNVYFQYWNMSLWCILLKFNEKYFTAGWNWLLILPDNTWINQATCYLKMFSNFFSKSQHIKPVICVSRCAIHVHPCMFILHLGFLHIQYFPPFPQ